MNHSERRIELLVEAIHRLNAARAEYDAAVALLDDRKRESRPWEVAEARMRVTEMALALAQGRQP